MSEQQPKVEFVTTEIEPQKGTKTQMFCLGKLVMGVTGWETLGVEIVQAIIWSCLALSMVFADISIHWKEILAAFSASARTPVPGKEAVPERVVQAA